MMSTESLVAKMKDPFTEFFRILYVDNFFKTHQSYNIIFPLKTLDLSRHYERIELGVREKLKFPKQKEKNIYINASKSICMVYIKDRNKFKLIITTYINIPKKIQRENKRKKKHLS